MKKYSILIIIIIAIVILGLFFYLNSSSNNSNNNTSYGKKTSTFINDNTNVTSSSNNEYTTSNDNLYSNTILNSDSGKELSSYNTIIKDDSEGRLINIGITCSTLNNTTISSGDTFSFNDIVGKPTSEKGYKEASIIINHKTEKGIGRWKLPGK